MNFKECYRKMSKTYQVEGRQTVLEHGLDVSRVLKNLIHDVRTKNDHDLNDLIPFLYDEKTLEKYAKFHDIGKVVCFSKDEKG